MAYPGLNAIDNRIQTSTIASPYLMLGSLITPCSHSRLWGPILPPVDIATLKINSLFPRWPGVPYDKHGNGNAETYFNTTWKQSLLSLGHLHRTRIIK